MSPRGSGGSASISAGEGRPYRRATLADVAAAVDVHVSTVSRALNGDPALSIRPEVRAKILAAARQQHYRPNALARALKRSRTGALGMVVPLLRNPIWSAIQRGALQQAALSGYVVMMLEEPEDDTRPPAEYQYLVDESRADGLLIATARLGREASSLVPSAPHVYLNRRGPHPGDDVVMDEEQAMRLFVDHLAEQGHRRLGVVDGTKEVDTVRRRSEATRQFAAALGMSASFQHEEDTEAGGYAAAQRLLARKQVPTAMGVGNLNQLFGVIKALRESGLDVPGDISLVSFDEDQCLGYLEVPVTSISMPLAELGAAAVRALVARVEGAGGTDVLVGEPLTLVRRGSTGPARR